jgi:single-strand DNA-binding protein
MKGMTMSGEASIQVVGLLGSDPEIKMLPSGTPITTMSLYHRNRIKRNDSWQDGETIRFLVKVWGSKGEAMVDTWRKGDLVTVDGTMEMERYTNKDGVAVEQLVIVADRAGLIPRANSQAASQRNQHDAGIEW